MTRRPLALVLLLALTGCSSGGAEAMVACEQLVDRRIGQAVAHLGPMEGATVEGEGPYVVHGGYTTPDGARAVRYDCTVERAGNGWRLLDLVTDR